MNEICGDGAMSPTARIAYLVRNLARNVAGGFAPLGLRRWPTTTAPAIHGIASPGRLLTEAFVRQALPELCKPGRVRVLDVGCGSGRMALWLAQAGYQGAYTGIDMDNRFAPPDGAAALSARFVQGDAHSVPLDGPFDLIVSVSALEHIADDRKLLDRLSHLTAPSGLQVHIVPGPPGLFAYLWHGYRQYGRRAIAERFDASGTAVYRLGGGATFLVHIFWITVPENMCRVSLRRYAPALYQRFVAAALYLDRFLPVGSVMYAVCVGNTQRGATR